MTLRLAFGDPRIGRGLCALLGHDWMLQYWRSTDDFAQTCRWCDARDGAVPTT